MDRGRVGQGDGRMEGGTEKWKEDGWDRGMEGRRVGQRDGGGPTCVAQSTASCCMSSAMSAFLITAFLLSDILMAAKCKRQIWCIKP